LNQNAQEKWTQPCAHSEKRDGLQPSRQVLGDPGKSRVKAEAVVKEEEDGSRGGVLEALYRRCQGPRSSSAPGLSALGISAAPLAKPRSSGFSRPALSRRHSRHCVQQSSQKKFWCHVPANNALSNQLARPEEAQLCWSAPSQLSMRAKAVCKSAPHLLFHLNDLPSLAGLSLSRACIQGNKSYQGKNGSKKLLKSQYPF